jgi:hypothetical protein
MNTTASTLSSITGFLFLMAGVPKVFGVPAPMGARVRAAFERVGMPTGIRIGTGAIEIAFAISLWIAAATDTFGLAIACVAAGIVVLVGAVGAHAKAKDPAPEYMPVAIYVALCATIIATAA